MRPHSSAGPSPARARARVCLGTAVLFLLTLVGCARRESPVEAGLKTGTLHVGNSAEPQDLDPHLTTGGTEGRIQRALFEGLIVPDPQTGRPSPGAATSWHSSPDGRTVTFALRPDGRWSDGAPVTAADFVATFRRLFTATVGAEFATEFYFIAGARAFHTGKTTDFSTVGVTAVDPLTVRFTLVDPVPQFLPLLSAAAALPIPVHVLQKHGALERRGTAWTRPGNLVGNGPFILHEWQQNQRIVVTRSPTYRGPSELRLQAIHFHPVEQADTEERMFRAGQLHNTAFVPTSKIQTYQRDQPAVLRVAPESRVYYYVFNVDLPPFHDLRVRRALALAIDRNRLVTQVLKAGQTPARQFAPPVAFDSPFPPQFEEDIAAARALLAAAGFPGGAGLPVFRLLITSSERNRLVAETVQEMWRQQLGVRLEIVSEEWKVYLDSLKNGAYQLSFDSWGFATPQQFYSLLMTGNSSSYNRWSDAAYDALVASASATADLSHRHDAYRRAEELIARVMPVIPIFFDVSTHLVHTDVKGWHTNPIDDRPWQPISLGR